MQTTPRIESWDEVMASKVEPVPFLLEGYVAEGPSLTFLFGKYGTFKTPITVNMAMNMAMGVEFWGLKVAKDIGPVLYVQCDTPPQILKPRMNPSLAGHTGVPLDFFWGYPGVNILQPNVDTINQTRYSELWALHQKKKYKLVFIDSLRTLHPLSDKDGEVVNSVYGALQKLFEGAAIVLVHHDKKTAAYDKSATLEQQDEMDSESFSGSQAWVNHATIGVKVKKVAKDEVKLKATKSQASELPPPLVLKITDGMLVDTPDVVNQSEYEKILAMVPKGLSVKDQDRAVAEFMGVSPRTAQRYRLGEYQNV